MRQQTNNKFNRLFLEFSNRLASLTQKRNSSVKTDCQIVEVESSQKLFQNQKCHMLKQSCLHPNQRFVRKNLEAKAIYLLENISIQLQRFSNTSFQKLPTQNYNSQLLNLIQNCYQIVEFAQRFWGALVTNQKIKTPDFNDLYRQISQLDTLYKKGKPITNQSKNLMKYDTKSIKQFSDMLTRPSSTHPSIANTNSYHQKKKGRTSKKHHKEFSEIKNSIFSEAVYKGCKSAFNKRHTLYFEVDNDNLQQFRNRNQQFMNKFVMNNKEQKEIEEPIQVTEDLIIKESNKTGKEEGQKSILKKSQQNTQNRKKVKFEVKISETDKSRKNTEEQENHVLRRKNIKSKTSALYYHSNKTAEHPKINQMQSKSYSKNQNQKGVIRRDNTLKTTKFSHHANDSQKKLKISEEQNRKKKRKVTKVPTNQNDSKKFIRDSYHDVEFNKKKYIKPIMKHRKPREKKVKFSMGSLFGNDLNIEEEQKQDKVFKIHYEKDISMEYQRIRPKIFSEIKIVYEDELEKFKFRPYNSLVIHSQKMINKPDYRSNTWRSFRFRPKGWNTIQNSKKNFYHQLWEISKQLRVDVESRPQDGCQNSAFFLYEDKIKQKQNMKLQRYLNDKQSHIVHKYFNMKEECYNYKKSFILQLQRKFIFDNDARNIAKRIKQNKDQEYLVQQQVKDQLVDESIF